MAEEDPILQRLVQRALEPTVRVALDMLPPSCVTLDARFTITYETEPGINFHVGFSLLDKNYDAGYVTTWEVLRTVPLAEQQLPPLSERTERNPRPRVHISQAVTKFGGGKATTTTLYDAAGGVSLSLPAVSNAGCAPSTVAADKSEDCDAPRRQLVTATGSVAIENLPFSWTLCQQVANEVMTVTLGRKDDGSVEQMPKAATNGGATQRGENLAAAKKGGGKTGTPTNTNVASGKDKGKLRSTKEVKALPAFETYRQEQIRVGSLLLLSDAGSVKPCQQGKQTFAELEGVRSFELELFCSQAPLSAAFRELVNPVCITFLGARRIPIPFPRASLHVSEGSDTALDDGVSTEPPTHDEGSSLPHWRSPGCPGNAKPAAHAESRWFPNNFIATPAETVVFSGPGADNLRCADVSWNHDAIVFWGPAVVNQMALRRFLEHFTFTVELHDQDVLATDTKDAVNGLSPATVRLTAALGTSQGTLEAKHGRFSSPGTAVATSLHSKLEPASATSTGGTADESNRGPRSTCLSSTGPSLACSRNASERSSRACSTVRASASGTKAKHSLRTEGSWESGGLERRIVRPYGVANFQLQDLLLHGLKQVELISDVFPLLGTGHESAAGQTPLLTDEAASNLLACPTDFLTSRCLPGKARYVATRYLDYGTQVKLRVRLSEPLPSIAEILLLSRHAGRAAQEQQTAAECDEENAADQSREEPARFDPLVLYEPFGCLVLFVDTSRTPLIHKIVKEVNRRNMKAMNVDTLDALSLEILPTNGSRNDSLDVFTGFILSDEKQCVVVIEGLRQGCLADFVEFVRKEVKSTSGSHRLLYNSRVGFQERYYSMFNLHLRWIFLRTPVETLLLSLNMLDSSTVESRQLARTLDRLAALARAERIHDVKVLNALPCPTGLLLLSHMHGGNDAQMAQEEETRDNTNRQDKCRYSQLAVARRSVTFADMLKLAETVTDSRRSTVSSKSSNSASTTRELQNMNTEFIAGLKERKEQAPVNMIEKNILGIKNGSNIRRTQKSPSRQTARDISTLSSQPLEDREAPFPSSHSQHEAHAPLPANGKAEKRVKDSRPPWRYPAPKSPAEFRRIGIKLPQDRLEELMTPWDEDAGVSSPWIRGASEPPSQTGSRLKHRSMKFEVASRSRGLFGPTAFFHSVHYSATRSAAGKAASELRSPKSIPGSDSTVPPAKMSTRTPLKSNSGMHFLNMHSHTKPSSCTLNLLHDCLRGSPRKLGIDFSQRKVPLELVEKYGEFAPVANVQPVRPLSADGALCERGGIQRTRIVEVDPWLHKYKVALQKQRHSSGVTQARRSREYESVVHTRSKVLKDVDFDLYRQPLENPTRLTYASTQATPISNEKKARHPGKWVVKRPATCFPISSS